MKLRVGDTGNYLWAYLRGASVFSWPLRSSTQRKEAEAWKRCRLSAEPWSESTSLSGRQTCGRTLEVNAGVPLCPQQELTGFSAWFPYFMDELLYIHTTCLQKALLGKEAEVSNVTTQSQQATQKAAFVFRVVSFLSQSSTTEGGGTLCGSQGDPRALGVCSLISPVLGCVAPCCADGLVPGQPTSRIM